MQRKEISFNGQSIYVGIDVHKATWSVTVLTEHSNLSKTFSQEASARKLFDFLKNQMEGISRSTRPDSQDIRPTMSSSHLA